MAIDKVIPGGADTQKQQEQQDLQVETLLLGFLHALLREQSVASAEGRGET